MPCHFYSQTNVLHSSNKVFSPKIRKLNAQHHKEENQSKTGFGAAIKQLPANPRCTFKCKYSLRKAKKQVGKPPKASFT